MHHFHLILTTAILGMLSFIDYSKEHTSLTSIEIHTQAKEDFNVFFERFKSDSLFQVSRTLFPFKEKHLDIYDDSMIEEERSLNDWHHLHFEYKKDYATREIDAYKQEVKIFTDTAKILLLGIDNGINVHYYFIKKQGKWFLSNKDDLST
ncbi:DUF4348 domain-containing protein [Fulvivirga maritima]|uniref:DUF4348 domain-containing protein n=1 Tax=Fulvivirga maritima TaxID=2904247 RepID=UPI001F253A5A|nr:DUF4348 domain-containing protein [Fulvivirga maritima]UII25345.1 DUF4348 domain-containing protein [Fulvivirga maritima]